MTNNWINGNVPDIGIDENKRKALCAMLNTLLADEYVHYVKAQYYHWNVLGVHFVGLHAFFERIFEQQQEIIDLVAERVRALGGKSEGSLGRFLELARIKEQTNGVPAPYEMVKNLLLDEEEIIRYLRKDTDESMEKYGDAGTNNMLAEILEKHEKIAWMLRALDDENFGGSNY